MLKSVVTIILTVALSIDIVIIITLVIFHPTGQQPAKRSRAVCTTVDVLQLRAAANTYTLLFRRTSPYPSSNSTTTKTKGFQMQKTTVTASFSPAHRGLYLHIAESVCSQNSDNFTQNAAETHAVFTDVQSTETVSMQRRISRENGENTNPSVDGNQGSQTSATAVVPVTQCESQSNTVISTNIENSVSDGDQPIERSQGSQKLLLHTWHLSHESGGGMQHLWSYSIPYASGISFVGCYRRRHGFMSLNFCAEYFIQACLRHGTVAGTRAICVWVFDTTRM